ncbi:glycosyltransferase family 2 protein [Photobacterium nomapromontoriensis]|uniref:glycosyltransferase family 2 protein n=1 Tax=Photobacterium nomapromontoriensis TaxID=2910237 RepID=UPI003D128AF9
MVMQLLAILVLIAILYHHLLYPLLLKLWASQAPKRVRGARSERRANQPAITLIIPAYNEADFISEKIANLGFIDYPANKLRIIIACDGCSDNTAQLALAAAARPENSHLNLDVREFKKNRGKVAVVNQIVTSTDTSWVALSDVSALISIDAFNVVSPHMNTPNIGVICSHYQLLDPGSEGEVAYWKYQNQIKVGEAYTGATLGSHGACYLFRREAFQVLPDDTINDDFVLPMMIVGQGYRAVYESNLHALELEKASLGMDFRRRIRIAAGNLQQVWRLKQLLLPQHGAIAFNFFSGKCLRVLMPYCMLLLLILSVLLSRDSWLWRGILLTQMIVYSSAVWVHFIQGGNESEALNVGLFATLKHRINRVMKLFYYLVVGHVANLVGSLRYMLGFENGRW